MVGGGLSYDVYIPVTEAPEHVRKACPGGTYYTVISRDGVDYYDFTIATLPKEISDMEQVWSRYQAWNAHEKTARRTMLVVARQVFPELNRFGDTLPTLWVHGLLKKETSASGSVNLQTMTANP